MLRACHGVPTIWAFVVCGVLLQRTYFLKRAVPCCRVLCSVCCLIGKKKIFVYTYIKKYHPHEKKSYVQVSPLWRVAFSPFHAYW